MNRFAKAIFYLWPMNTTITLAIAPGKRELGVAVFSGLDLIYLSVKTIRDQKTEMTFLEKLTDILQRLFQEFSIKAVVIKAISQYQKLSRDLAGIIERIRFESKQKNLPVEEITIEQIKSELCITDKPTQKKAFETLLGSYPELEQYWNRPNKWQNDYYAFLFSAVAVGTVYLNTFSEAA
jgi:Holliday junction resolvasome RuvABC endonuclease subunit